MLSRRKGRYRARFAETPDDILAAQRLRTRAFHGAHAQTLDADPFDDICDHVLVEDQRDGALVCCFRILPLTGGQDIARSYSAQYYELSALEAFDGPMVEMGRFCIDPEVKDPDILRVAWAAMTTYVDEQGVEMLFGCSSFHGTDARQYRDAFAMLKERHLAPKRWLPKVKAPKVFRFAQKLRRKPDAKQAMLRMPPLLRTYLLMGGWVSDHAVVDSHMNTLHVFTGLEIRAIPPARKRLLRATAMWDASGGDIFIKLKEPSSAPKTLGHATSFRMSAWEELSRRPKEAATPAPPQPLLTPLDESPSAAAWHAHPFSSFPTSR